MSDRYLKEAVEYGTKDAHIEFFVHEDMIRMVGIPSKEMLENVQRIFGSKVEN